MDEEIMTSFRFGLVRVISWIVLLSQEPEAIHEITRIKPKGKPRKGVPIDRSS
jgi:hypothetical protein